MMRTAINGYAGWEAIDKITGLRIKDVLWVDPEDKSYCTIDEPYRVVAGEVAHTVYRCSEVTADLPAMRFWIVRTPTVVAPLNPGRQQAPERTDQPCADCCQPDTCKRIDYCAAHRCAFGERAP